MPLRVLPNELLLRIAWFVLKCATCNCHHASDDLSALARSSTHLYFVLTPELHRTASAVHMLVWGIANSRQDTVTLALTQGANPNVPLREIHHIARITSHVLLGTPLEIAFRLRMEPNDPASHQLNLEMCISLLLGGGKPSIECLSAVVRAGDLDLLRGCLPFIANINAHARQGGRTLLEVAGSSGHLGVVALILAAGALVNSVGLHGNPDYFPPLWTLCRAPVSVLKLLLEAGADPTWEHDGETIVRHLLQDCRSTLDLEGNIDMLELHGAQVPKRMAGILLSQAPVWELWTGGDDELVECSHEQAAVDQVLSSNVLQVWIDYHGWELPTEGSWDEWGPRWRHPDLPPGCMCPKCPLPTTGGYRTVRPLAGWVPV